METSKEKFEKQFEEMKWVDKARAIGALERENERYNRQKFIYDDTSGGDRVIEITEFENYHFVKYFDGHSETVRYKVYINNKSCFRITENPKMILLIALAHEYDGSNTQAHKFMARMLEMQKEEA